MDTNHVVKQLLLGIAIFVFTLMSPICREGYSQRNPSQKQIIKLAENNWLAAKLNTAIARILLKEEMGYNVEVVTIDEHSQFPAVARGDIHASLEVWSSGHRDEITTYIMEGTIEDGGPLGPIGKIGWYIPAYLLDDHPELATWEGFKKPENVVLFRSSKSGGKGEFLTGSPAWIQYDADIIRNLGLDFQVLITGSEEALLRKLDDGYRERRPILFYFWTPHSAFARYKLAEVKLPEYNVSSYNKANAGKVDCDYPADVLMKIFWIDFKQYAPKAYGFLKSFRYTNEDQISMMAMVDFEKKTVDEAARFWIEKNKNIWKGWVP